jgi:hypothetical protein
VANSGSARSSFAIVVEFVALDHQLLSSDFAREEVVTSEIHALVTLEVRVENSFNREA